MNARRCNAAVAELRAKVVRRVADAQSGILAAQGGSLARAKHLGARMAAEDVLDMIDKAMASGSPVRGDAGPAKEER